MLRARGRGGVCDRAIGSSGGMLRALIYKRSGGALQACKRGGVYLKRSGAREVCCGRGDVEGVCIKRSGGTPQACKRGGIEV